MSKLMVVEKAFSKWDDNREKSDRRNIMNQETALHDIEQIEEAILFEQEQADEKMRKAVDKINSYRERIEELRQIVNNDRDNYREK